MKTDGSNAGDKQVATQSSPTMLSYINSMVKEIERALPKTITVERMTRIFMTAISKNPQLGQCSRESFLGSMLTAAQLGLEVNTPLGHSYLIPRFNKKKNVLECGFQMGYQGIIDLCYRTGMYARIKAVSVMDGDVFDYQCGTSAYIKHVPKHKSNRVTHIYAIYTLTNGGEDFEVWSYDEVIDHAKTYSDTWDDVKQEFKYGSAWRDDPVSMGKKTVLIALLKYAQKSVDVARAASADGHVMTVRTIYDGEARTVVAEPEYTPAGETEPAQGGYNEEGDGSASEGSEESRAGIAEPSQEGKVQQSAEKKPAVKTAAAPAKKTDAQIQQDLLDEAAELGMTGTVPPDFEA